MERSNILPSNNSIRFGYDDRKETNRAHAVQRQKESDYSQDMQAGPGTRSGVDKMLKATVSSSSAINGAHVSHSPEDRKKQMELCQNRLQFLNEQLIELNLHASKFQQGASKSIPMVPVGLKEIITIDATNVECTRHILQVLQNYFRAVRNASDDDEVGRMKKLAQVEHAIKDFLALRNRACRKPVRDINGIRMLYEYYNQLCFVEQRFFVTGNEDVEFHW